MLCVTLAQDDQIRLIDDEEEEEMENNVDELENISGVAEKKRKIVCQTQTFEKELYFQWKSNFNMLVKKIIYLPHFLYYYYLNWKECNVNDFIDTV